MGEVLKDMSLQKTRNRLEDLQNETLQNINDQLTIFVEEMMKDVEKCEVSHEFNQLFKNKNNTETFDGKLRDKKFTHRNSLLTDLFAIKHISTIYNIFIVIILFLFLHSAISDYFETGSISFGISTIRISFQGFIPLGGLWICMFVATLFLYSILNIWAHLNYYTFGTGITFFCEQIRFMMKCHAFVRSNISSVLNYNDMLKLQSGTHILPKFSKYLFFLFAPTLVYQENYPRTKEIRWRFLLWNVLELIVILFVCSHVFERHVLDVYEDYGVIHYDLKILLYKIISLSGPALFIYLALFYLFLHSWHNAWAEGLRFADRLFYKDWWNVSNYSEYFRKWNIIVHDWLYIYIYKDLYEHFGCDNILFPYLSVFIISSVFHEYILGMAIQVFYPVLLIFFTAFGCFAVVLSKQLEKISKNAGNILLWMGFSFGTSLIFALYALELYARQNCDCQNESIYGFFIPRSWFCNK
ncbi:sterol O-acyltransferase 1-like [Chrysoperla carnea]|uniref:sterol O-acyltransferase 1-like n=1 Tax=Chrysoperla carnea TaxID=189513 RepID=UPI001D098356|nr:sterol O-acyltransferase 1-like [Chrysoperla carnea]